MKGAPNEAAPMGDRILDPVVWAFALWTLLCFILTAMGQSFAMLVALSPLVPALLWASRGLILGISDGEEMRGVEAPKARASVMSVSLLAAVLAPAVAFGGQEWILGWVLAMVSLLLVASTERWISGGESIRRNPPKAGITLLIFLTVIVAFGVRRPDSDDGAYHAIAIAAAENPESPLLCCDVVHGVDNVPLNPLTQRFVSLDLLVAMPMFLVGVVPWQTQHFLFPILGAAGLCLVYRRLYRRLIPDRWRSALIVTLLLLMTLGGAHAWHGNFGLVRLHQGKGLLVSVLLPLIAVYGLEAGTWGGVGRWIRLLGAQVAAIGVNQTALVLGPITAMIAVMAAFSGRERRPGSSYLVFLITLIPAAFGWSLWPEMSSRFERSIGSTQGAELLQKATKYVFGDGHLAALVALACLLCPWLVPRGAARRWALLAPLVVLAFPLNPWLARMSAAWVFGDATFWRFFWILPLIAILALTITAFEGLEKIPRRAARGVTVLVLLLTLAVVDQWLMGSDNRVDWAPFEPKIPPQELAAARALVEAVPPNSLVLAHPDVAPWVLTFPERPFLWAVRRTYLRKEAGHLDDRWALLRWASGRRRASDIDLLGKHLPLFSGVLLDQRIAHRPEVRDELTAAGFEKQLVRAPYALWIRRTALDDPKAPAEIVERNRRIPDA